MLPTTFRALFQGPLVSAPLFQPDSIDPAAEVACIVARFGTVGEYLTLQLAPNGVVHGAWPPPLDNLPTLFARRCATALGRADLVFCFQPTPPTEVKLAGSFRGAVGSVHLAVAEQPRLLAWAIHWPPANAPRTADETEAVDGVPDRQHSWHLAASKAPWDGETMIG